MLQRSAEVEERVQGEEEKMTILSHRGLWLNPEERNTRLAFERSFENGFGVETDIRDYQGKLVISHDMANQDSMLFEEFCSIYSHYRLDLPLALNIKSDGLQKPLQSLLDKYAITNYFVFDMSIPDMLLYCQEGLEVFSRQSEYESLPALYGECAGVWLDEFRGHWINKQTIWQHLENSKKVCIVSPELHKRDFMEEWQEYREIQFCLKKSKEIMLCTDYPQKAKEFFNDKSDYF